MNKILIVDNEPDVNLTLKVALEDGGFRVDTFNDPMLALENFKARSYDLLILDIKMPNMSGFDLYREIKKVDNKVKVCFLTAGEMYYGTHQDIFDTLDADCFIRKPVENKELIERVNKIMNYQLQ